MQGEIADVDLLRTTQWTASAMTAAKPNINQAYKQATLCTTIL